MKTVEESETQEVVTVQNCECSKCHSTVHFKMLCCSVAKSCPALFEPMDCSMPDFPFLY